ncbi:39S ribosomal protein L42, mitochondrial [Corythoichthys intestinalis]|uniref:39S ribosomal protein L42, mitochondrial n=1 Tax=Corythoichthys intestinalis TaxID=161448 RepID=UPI0025A5029A|nr:39S ribosomal protein L42, mitochondrial [Corythoichthys intestinalis]XP_061809130.1 39S ribosomal protein L42, mitochondrial [Nerophis lumbriciformis]
MASGHLSKISSLITCVYKCNRLRIPQACLVQFRDASNRSIDDCSDVEIGLTSDGKTVVCYHPPVDIPYELTQPIERPDPLCNPPETHEQVLKAHLSKEMPRNQKGPSVEELSKMFFTTKHRWYPFGQYRMRRIKKNPPKDR